jgi:DNA polymerase-3 subunit delta'
MAFSSVMGQPAAIERIKACLSAKRVPPGILFCGPSGVGKMLAAREMAKALMCDGGMFGAQEDGGCGECINCRQVDKGVHPDLVIVDTNFQAQLREEEAEEQKHLRVETMRSVLEMAQRKASGGWKVIIVDHAETMLSQAQNSLLKLLEEPPPETLWILLAEKREDMLPTILSRCQTMRFAPLSDEALSEILVQQGCAMDEAQKLCPLAGGSVSRALRIRELLEDFSALDPLSPLYPFRAAATLPRELADARKDAALIIELLEQALLARWRRESRPRMRDDMKRAMTHVLSCREYINRNVSPSITLEAALLETARFKLNIFDPPTGQ